MLFYILHYFPFYFNCLHFFILLYCVTFAYGFHPNSVNVVQNNLTIAFGSCSKQYRSQAYWNVIQNHHSPYAWFWIGDAFYPNCSSLKCVRLAHEQVRKAESYNEFRNSISFLDGIWDDHDYGINDGGMYYIYKKESSKLYLDFLQIDLTDIRHKQSGLYSSHVFLVSDSDSDSRSTNSSKIGIHVILMDTRFNREDSVVPSIAESQIPLSNKIAVFFRILTGLTSMYKLSNGDMLGEEQWKWLEQALAMKQYNNTEIVSTILISSTKVFSTDPTFESWSHYPQSRRKLFEIIQKTSPRSLVVLSGDVHYAELTGKINCIPEITSSGLTHSVSEHTIAFYILKYILHPIFYLNPLSTNESKKDESIQWLFKTNVNSTGYYDKNFGVLTVNLPTIINPLTLLNISVYSLDGNNSSQIFSVMKNANVDDTSYECLNDLPTFITTRGYMVSCGIVTSFIILLCLRLKQLAKRSDMNPHKLHEI